MNLSRWFFNSLGAIRKNIPHLFTQRYALPTAYTMSIGPIKLAIKTN